MSSQSTAYIIYDIETVPDGQLIADVLYPGQDLSPDEAITQQEQEVLKATDGRSSFVPLTFQYPVAIAVARVGPDFRLQKVAKLDAPLYRTRTMVDLFWKGIQAYPKATLVDFGGRQFDLPVMELCAYRFGLPVPDYFGQGKAKTYRHRWSDQHLDLLEWYSNWNACRMKGGLNLLAKMIGKPGKMDVKGELVLELWREGKKNLIGSYCLCDVLDTYFVFLRSRLLMGQITPEEEARIEGEARNIIEDIAFDDTNVEEYLNRCRPRDDPPGPADATEPPLPEEPEPAGPELYEEPMAPMDEPMPDAPMPEPPMQEPPMEPDFN